MDYKKAAQNTSPVTKKARYENRDAYKFEVKHNTTPGKRPKESLDTPTKRQKRIHEDEASLKRNQEMPSGISSKQNRINFVSACQHVANTEYFNATKRFGISCILRKDKSEVLQISGCKQEAFNIDYNSHMWCEALDVSRDIISHNICLSADIMQSICEIILNAHEAKFESYSIKYILDRCRHILNLNYNTHLFNNSRKLRKCFEQFLTKPMQQKEGSYSNREDYNSQSGIFKYCIRRISKEINPKVDDSPLVDKFLDLPSNIAGVQEIHWKKDKFEILETLNKTERLRRLFFTLDCLVDLLQKDFNLWFQRYSSNPIGHISNSHKPLIAFITSQNDSKFTGDVSRNVYGEIFKAYADLVDYGYNEQYLCTFSKLLNLIAELMLMLEEKSGEEYPLHGKYVFNMSLELFTIFQAYSYNTMLKALEHITTPCVKYLLGEMFLKHMLNLRKTSDTLTSIKIILKDYRWDNDYIPVCGSTKVVDDYAYRNITINKLFSKFHKLLKYKLKDVQSKIGQVDDAQTTCLRENEYTEEHVIKILFITLQSYLDAYALQDIHEYLNNCNSREIKSQIKESDTCHKMDCDLEDDDLITNMSKIKTNTNKKIKLSETAVKRYREIFSLLKEIIKIFESLTKTNPDVVDVFKSIELLGLQ